MLEQIATLVNELDGRPEQFEQLRVLLNDPGLREEYSDYAEELVQRESARYSTALFERIGFHSELVRSESKQLNGKEQLDALSKLNEQFPRMIEAIENELNMEDSICLVKFASSIASLLHMQGKLELGIAVFKRLLDRANRTGNGALEARAGRYYGQFLTQAGMLDKAYVITVNAMRQSLLDGDEFELANVQIALGDITRYLGRLEEAREFYRMALDSGSKLQDQYLISGALCSLGLIALEQCRLEEAGQLFTESLQKARETGNQYRIAGDLHNLACVAVAQGNYEDGIGLYKEALEINRSMGNRTFEVRNLQGLGCIAQEQGRLDEAKQYYSEAQIIAVEIDVEPSNHGCYADQFDMAAALGKDENQRRPALKDINLSRKNPYCSCDWR